MPILPTLPGMIAMPGGELYQAVLVKIDSRDEHMAPCEMTLIPPGCPLEMPGNQHFIIIYLDQRVLHLPPTVTPVQG